CSQPGAYPARWVSYSSSRDARRPPTSAARPSPPHVHVYNGVVTRLTRPPHLWPLAAPSWVQLGLLWLAGAALRVTILEVPPLLLAMTVLMGLGIAVSQPSLPALVKQWCPDRVGLATAVYSNGLLIGEIAAAALTVPLVLPLVGGSWQRSFLIWSLPVALTAI